MVVKYENEENWYEVLGVTRTATPSEVKRAYLKLCRKHHPDKGGDKAMFQRINQANETLSDPRERALFDRRLRAREEKAQAKQVSREAILGPSHEIIRQTFYSI